MSLRKTFSSFTTSSWCLTGGTLNSFMPVGIDVKIIGSPGALAVYSARVLEINDFLAALISFACW